MKNSKNEPMKIIAKILSEADFSNEKRNLETFKKLYGNKKDE